MIDIHHHLLYGLDDGAPDLETSVAMAEAAIANGVTHVVCTPHASHRYPFDPAANHDRLTALEARLDGRITLGLGCDFHLSYDNIEDHFRNPGKYTINGKGYLLVEFPDFGIAATISDTLYHMAVTGAIPIITHPERNATLKEHPYRMADWLRSGCLVQITAGSLLGRFGKTAEAMSHQLLRDNWVHILASDAHNTTSRPVQLREARELVARQYGQETADRLAIHNPRAVFYGERMPPQPEPIGLDEDPTAKKQGFFSKLFSR